MELGMSSCRSCGEMVSNRALECPHCHKRPWGEQKPLDLERVITTGPKRKLLETVEPTPSTGDALPDAVQRWGVRPCVDRTGNVTRYDICLPADPDAKGVAVIASVYAGKETADDIVWQHNTPLRRAALTEMMQIDAAMEAARVKADAPIAGELEGLIKALLLQEDSGQRAIGGGTIKADGTGTSWGGEKIMRLRNPDGPRAAAALASLQADNARLTEAGKAAELVLSDELATETEWNAALRQLRAALNPEQVQ